MDLNWYKDCGLREDLMLWVYRLEKRWPGLWKNRNLWKLIRTMGYESFEKLDRMFFWRLCKGLKAYLLNVFYEDYASLSFLIVLF
jgi:hypothetical protein